MPLTASLAAGRRAKAARMTSTCRVERVTGEATDSNGLVTQTRDVVLANSFCYLPSDPVDATSPRAGDVAALTEQRTSLQLPWDTTGVRGGDLVTILTARTPANVGRVLRVVAVALDEDATALRLSCEEVT